MSTDASSLGQKWNGEFRWRTRVTLVDGSFKEERGTMFTEFMTPIRVWPDWMVRNLRVKRQA